MKYIEEIDFGDLFSYNDKKYILSCDFKKHKNSKKHMCVSILDGSIKWFESDTIIDVVVLYHRDNEGNIFLLKEFKDDFSKDKNIY